MELQYRGTSYTATPEVIETSELPITGTYRGQEVAFKVPQSEPQSLIKEELIYRGIHYMPGHARPGEVALNSRLFMQLRRSRRTRHPAFRGS